MLATYVARATEWIASQRPPFFAWVHLYDPHAPYDPPPPFDAAHEGRPYDGEVAYADAWVGRLLSAAGSAAKAKPLVAVMADHGEALGEHGETTHGFFVYQSTLRIPLLLAGPGIPKGARRPGPARSADLLPTLLGRLGIVEPGLDGADLLAGPGPGEAYAETFYPRSFGWAPLRSYRSGELKLIEAPRPELYDLASDAAELRNVAGERPEELLRLRQALAAFRRTERAATAVAPDADVAERLAALGYVASAPGPTRDEGTLTDPKDALELWRAFEEATWADNRGETEAALRGLRDLLEREPRNPVFRRTLAATLRRTGRTEEAVVLMAGLADLAPEDPVAWHERALALAGAGRLDEARQSEARAIGLNPLLPEPHNHLGVLEAARGRLAAALQSFETALALDPGNARAWNNRGNVLRELGRPEEAREAYRRAIEHAPRDPDPLNGLGVLAAQSGQAAEAARLFRRALGLAPRLSEARLNLAVAEAQQGRTDAARSEATQALRETTDPALKAKATAFLADLARTRPRD